MKEWLYTNSFVVKDRKAFEVLKPFLRNDSKSCQMLANMVGFFYEVKPIRETTGDQLQHRIALVASGHHPRLSGSHRYHHCGNGRKASAQEERVVIYARVSSPEHKENLERQAERLV